MAGSKELFEKFAYAASNPKKLFEQYLSEGKKVVLTAPVYTPEEIIYSMGAIPMGVWGADIQLSQSKQYFPAFICSIMQSILELGMTGVYKGASAIVIPSLCDSLKCLGENWKYAVKDIPFIPMTYPQHRKPQFGYDYCRAGYERVIKELEKSTGLSFDDGKLAEAVALYSEHAQAMQQYSDLVEKHPEVSCAQRNSVFKSAWFMDRAEHLAILKELISALENEEPGAAKKKIITSGILCDSPELLQIFDEYGFSIVADDVAAESRQYRYEAPEGDTGLDKLTDKFCSRNNCSVLYDVNKERVSMLADMAVEKKADGIIVVLTKFCDPEEFDYPMIKKACNEKGVQCLLIEVDRQMDNMGQARTMIEAFADMI